MTINKERQKVEKTIKEKIAVVVFVDIEYYEGGRKDLVKYACDNTMQIKQGGTNGYIRPTSAKEINRTTLKKLLEIKSWAKDLTTRLISQQNQGRKFGADTSDSIHILDKLVT